MKTMASKAQKIRNSKENNQLENRNNGESGIKAKAQRK